MSRTPPCRTKNNSNVSFRFEPKQRSSKVHIEISQDAEAKALTDQADKIASAAGLKRVGWMFTDLERDAKNTKRFIVKRHKGTYFLKSNELALAAYLQSQFPNRCDFAESGYAGSKFATVVLSGCNERQEDNIEPSVYQVCIVCCMSLVFCGVSHASALCACLWLAGISRLFHPNSRCPTSPWS